MIKINRIRVLEGIFLRKTCMIIVINDDMMMPTKLYTPTTKNEYRGQHNVNC